MPDQPRDLIDARVLLSKFESEIERPESLVYLSEALSLLADVATDTASAELKQICSNLTSTYASMVQAKVQPLLTQEFSTVDWKAVDHWLKVFSEFERSGFALPSQVTECHSAL
jgi:hypothetical protein